MQTNHCSTYNGCFAQICYQQNAMTCSVYNKGNKVQRKSRAIEKPHHPRSAALPPLGDPLQRVFCNHQYPTALFERLFCKGKLLISNGFSPTAPFQRLISNVCFPTALFEPLCSNVSSSTVLVVLIIMPLPVGYDILNTRQSIFKQQQQWRHTASVS